MRLLIVDNFDSFTYNLVHYLEQLVDEVVVETNLSVDLNQLPDFDGVVLSPGPGLPAESGLLMDVIETCRLQRIPVFGVCLGMQALALDRGDELYNQEIVKHGIQEEIRHFANSQLYDGIPETFRVGLYHSWAVRLQENSPFILTSISNHDVAMSILNEGDLQFGVQFHPESILTEQGFELMKNAVNQLKKMNIK